MPPNSESLVIVACQEPQLDEYMDVVRQVARSVRRRLPPHSVDLEELEADGFEGLVRAMRDYDATKGELAPWIVLRCRGAMLDGLRRRMANGSSTRAPGTAPPVLVSLESEQAGGRCLGETVADPHAATAEDVIERVSSAEVAPALASLPHRHRRILFARFVQRRTQSDVAAAEGVSRKTVAQFEFRLRHRLGVSRGSDERPLTPKELKVLRLAAEGATTEETAQRLHRASETVKSQRGAIITKLRARNLVNAVAIAYQRGLLH
jgi:RNA polymerase sigma factor (sigma-70 family)